MIELQINSEQLGALTSSLSATERQIDLALKSTFKRLKGWLRKKIAPDMARAVNLQQKIIRRRIKYRSNAKNEIWFGLNSVGFKYLKPKKTSTGVSAYGGKKEDGAFITKTGTVFKRKTNKRLPLEVVETSIYQEAISYLETETIQAQEFEAEFFRVFERELKWRTNP
jgi:hypothetical protein